MASNAHVDVVRVGQGAVCVLIGCVECSGQGYADIALADNHVSQCTYGPPTAGPPSAHGCMCRRCLRARAPPPQNSHGNKHAAVARLRAAAAGRAAARKKAEKAKLNRTRAKRHKQRRRKRDARTAAMRATYARHRGAPRPKSAGVSGPLQPTSNHNEHARHDANGGFADSTVRRGEQVARKCAMAALQEASGKGSAFVVATLLTMIRDQSVWGASSGVPERMVEDMITCHYNELPESAQFELLLSRMQRQPSHMAGSVAH